MPTSPVPNNLPKLTQPLYGRQSEFQQAWELLQNHRVVTFTGPAGVGRSFLALHLAQAHLQDFPGGVYFVRLRTEPIALNAIVRAVGAEDNPQKTLVESVCARLSGGASLLVLDGATLAHQMTEFIPSLLEGAPEMRILVTADELLYLPGEQIVVVPPLALPQPDPHARSETMLEYLQRIPAVSMFVQLAQAANPAFRLEPEQSNQVVALCNLVGGLPLGLQLAAAQCSRMPLEQILAGLQAARQAKPQGSEAQVMTDVLDWSVGLLDEAARNLLFDLSVFNGNFSPQAVPPICAVKAASQADLQPHLAALRSHALLREEPSGNPSEGRYYLPAAVQIYALEHLRLSGRAEALHNQHALYYVQWAEQAEAGLKGPEQPQCLNLFEMEYTNLCAAIQWATQPAQAELAVRLAGTLTLFWIIRSYFREALACLDPVLELAHSASDQTSAKAFNGAGVMASGLGNYESARLYFHQALARARIGKDQVMTARVLNNLGIVAGERAEYSQASHFFAEALEIQQAIGDQWGACNVQMNLGIVENHRGEHALARQHFEQCLEFARQAGVQNLIALNLDNLGEALINLGELELARSRFEESLRLARELENQETISHALGGLGKSAFFQGNLDEALGYIQEALAVLNNIGYQTGLAGALHWQGEIYCAQGKQAEAAEALIASLKRGSALGLRKEVCQTLVCLARLALLCQGPERAARLLGAAEHLRQEIELTFGLPEQELRQHTQEEASSQLGEAAWRAAWEEGLELTLKQAVALGLQPAASTDAG